MRLIATSMRWPVSGLMSSSRLQPWRDHRARKPWLFTYQGQHYRCWPFDVHKSWLTFAMGRLAMSRPIFPEARSQREEAMTLYFQGTRIGVAKKKEKKRCWVKTLTAILGLVSWCVNESWLAFAMGRLEDDWFWEDVHLLVMSSSYLPYRGS